MAADQESAEHRNIAAIYPLTPVQEGILYHTLYAPEAPLYIQQYSARLEGSLDSETYQRAWSEVVHRHEALRALLTWKGRERPLQIVRDRVELEWYQADWADRPGAEQPAALAEFLETDRQRGFDLEVAPLMRFALLRLAPDVHQFVWSHHHLVLDGWSMGIVLDEVQRTYQAQLGGRQPELGAPASYRSYIQWLERQTPDAAQPFFAKLVGDVAEAAPLISEPELGPSSSPWAAGQLETSVELDAAHTGRLVTFARANGLTINTVLQGAWALVMSRYSNRDDVVFGATSAGRPPELEGSTEMVGMFINTLPVRVAVDHDASVVEWLAGIQRRQVEASKFESTPLVQVQSWSGVPAGRPLFQTVLVFENVPQSPANPGGPTPTDVHYHQQSNYPLAVLVMPGESLGITLIYDPDRFEADMVGQVANQLLTVITSLTEDRFRRVKDVEFFPPAQLLQILDDWNDTAVDYPRDRTITELIDAATRQRLDDPAVIAGGLTLTYGDLHSRADQLANRLRTIGLGPGRRACIALDRSAATLVAILGVLASGAAYVPLDPEAPNARRDYVLAETDASALIVGNQPEGVALPTVRLDDSGNMVDSSGDFDGPTGPLSAPDDVAPPCTPDDLAYVLYTSGSTGQPKGVAVTHRNLVHSTTARAHIYERPVGRFLLLSPFVFDSSLVGIFWTLCQGGTLVLPEPRMEQDVHHLAELISRQRITHTLALPTLYSLILEHGDPASLASLEVVIVAGEPCPPSLIRDHLATLPHTALFNEYGPTEATVWTTVADLARGSDPNERPGRVSIGRPIANTRAYVLDHQHRVAPPGVAGELVLAGEGLAQGYLADEELTAARFPERSIEGRPAVRVYHTGDIASFDQSGSLYLAGRADHQVKIRGRRVELGEIEMVLQNHPAVREAAVVLRSDEGTDRSPALVAYVEPVIDSAELARFAKDRLPDVMRPDLIVSLDTLPRGATGKVDRNALPSPEPGPAPATHPGAVPPSTETEAKLAAIWSEVLGVETVGVTDNFFDLGGDSILSIRIIARAHQAGISITPRQFFDNPTVEEIAALDDP